jgi:hypothetical protein
MGYYTRYNIRVTGADNSNQMVKFAEELDLIDYEIAGEDGTVLGANFEDKWYDWERDMKRVSKSFPRMLIEVDGKGEDAEDIWMARIRDGDSEIIYAKIVFDDFKIIK